MAADVGGLPTTVGDAGVLVQGHDPAHWARVIGRLVDDPGHRAVLARRAVLHASTFGWGATTDRLLEVYRQAVGNHAETSIDASRRLAGIPIAVTP